MEEILSEDVYDYPGDAIDELFTDALFTDLLKAGTENVHGLLMSPTGDVPKTLDGVPLLVVTNVTDAHLELAEEGGVNAIEDNHSWLNTVRRPAG